MKFACVILILLNLFSLFFLVGNGVGDAHASTPVSGLITSDTTWTLINSPYQLTGSLKVASGATLTIEPGVIVDLGVYDLIINGAITANGRSNNQIKLISQRDPSNFDEHYKGQILFNYSRAIQHDNSKADSLFDNTVFEKASIWINYGSPTIKYCIFNNPYHIAIFSSGGSPIIYSNHFYNVSHEGISVDCSTTVINNWLNATVGMATAIVAHDNAYVSENRIFNFYNGITTDGNTRIKGNSVVNCTNYGIWDAYSKAAIESNYITKNNIGINYQGTAKVVSNAIINNKIGLQLSSRFPYVVSYNNIYGNTQESVQIVASISNMNLSNNWWRTTDAHAINETLGFNSGIVFTPFLNQPSNSAPSSIDFNLNSLPTPPPIPTYNPPTPTQTIPQITVKPTANNLSNQEFSLNLVILEIILAVVGIICLICLIICCFTPKYT